MTLTCGEPSDARTTCPFCLHLACNACPREPERPTELRICQHTSVERHRAMPALARTVSSEIEDTLILEADEPTHEQEPAVNRTPTVRMPSVQRERVRITLDFSSGNIAEVAHAFERLAVIARRGGKVVLVEEDVPTRRRG